MKFMRRFRRITVWICTFIMVFAMAGAAVAGPPQAIPNFSLCDCTFASSSCVFFCLIDYFKAFWVYVLPT
jgi:hypothetical protein